MAEQQFKRTRQDAPRQFAEGDPLAELARIVGFDRPDETGDGADQPDSVDNTTMDLEAELLRELQQPEETDTPALHGPTSNEPNLTEPAPQRPHEAAAPAGQVDTPSEPAPLSAADEAFDDTVMVSLENELFEEIEAGFAEESGRQVGSAHPEYAGPDHSEHDWPERDGMQAADAGAVAGFGDAASAGETGQAGEWRGDEADIALDTEDLAVEPASEEPAEDFSDGNAADAPAQGSSASPDEPIADETVEDEPVEDASHTEDAVSIDAEPVAGSAGHERDGHGSGGPFEDAETTADVPMTEEAGQFGTRAIDPASLTFLQPDEGGEPGGEMSDANSVRHETDVLNADDPEEGDASRAHTADNDAFVADFTGLLRHGQQDEASGPIEDRFADDAQNPAGAAPVEFGETPDTGDDPDLQADETGPFSPDEDTVSAEPAYADDGLSGEAVGMSFEDTQEPAPVPAPDESSPEPTENDRPASALNLPAGEATPDGSGVEPFVFDAAALSEHDEPVAAMAAMDLPGMPEDDEPIAVSEDDFEFDLDADLAALIDDGKTGAVDVPAAAHDDDASPLQDSAAAPASGRVSTYEALALDDPALAYSFGENTDEQRFENGVDRAGFTDDTGLGDAGMAGVAAGARPPSRRASGGGRRFALTALAVILLAGGAGAAVWTSLGTDTLGSAEPPVIVADAGPVKSKPTDPGGKSVPNQHKIVYDRVDGTKTRAPQQKALVTASEEPVDVVQRTLDPDILPRVTRTEKTGRAQPAAKTGRPAAGDALDGAPDAAAASAMQKAEDRLRPVLGARDSAGGMQETRPAGVAPRRVRTMIVTADGKLVARDPAPADQSAGQGQADSERAPGPLQSAPDASAGSDDGAPLAQPGFSTGSQAPVPQARPANSSTGGATKQSADSTWESASAPAGAKAPADPDPVVAKTPAAEAPATTNSTTPTETETAKQAPAANPGGYMIQIASQPTEAGAQASYQTLSKRFGSVLGGRGVDIQRAEIDGRGVYYRVRIPAGSRKEAISLCQTYKSSGGSCFVTR